MECFERRSFAPDAETDHVCHVLGLRGAGGRGVDNSSFRELPLQIEDGLTRLGWLTAVPTTSSREKVLCFVTFVEDNAAVKVFTAPVDNLKLENIFLETKI